MVQLPCCAAMLLDFRVLHMMLLSDFDQCPQEEELMGVKIKDPIACQWTETVHVLTRISLTLAGTLTDLQHFHNAKRGNWHLLSLFIIVM